MRTILIVARGVACTVMVTVAAYGEETVGAELRQALEWNAAGHQLAVQGRFVEAEPYYRRSIPVLQRSAPAHPRFAAALNNLAEAVWRQGRNEEALLLTERAVAVLELDAETNSAELVTALSNAGMLHLALGAKRAAFVHLERCVEIAAASRQEPSSRAQVLNKMTSLYMADGHWARADKVLRQAEALLEGAEPAVRADTYTIRGILHARLGQNMEADQTLAKAEAVTAGALGVDHVNNVTVLFNRAVVLRRLRRYAEAAERLERATIIERRSNGADSAQLAPLLEEYAAVLKRQGRREEARRASVQASELPRRAKSGQVVSLIQLQLEK